MSGPELLDAAEAEVERLRRELDSLRAQIDRTFSGGLVIGSDEFNTWARGVMPAFVESDVVISAITESTSVVRILFDLGRMYQQLVDANRQHKESTTT